MCRSDSLRLPTISRQPSASSVKPLRQGKQKLSRSNGTVLLARYGHASYGNYVVVGHGGGVTTLYAHCSALNVTVGQAVSAGDVVAFVGSTGDSTGDHLHLEVNDNGTLKNPREYLP